MSNQDERYAVEAQEESSPSTVQWEEPNLQQLSSERPADDTSQNRAVFFAKVIRTASEDDVKVVFSQFGTVLEVSLFRAFQGAPTTKVDPGCGILTMSTSEEAATAIAALDNKYVWPGMDCPMAVKWMDTQLQQRRRDQHLAAMRHRTVGPMAPAGPDSWMGSSMMGPPAMMNPLMRQAKMKLSEAPPAGCDQDALKLFVGNIPRSYTEEQLQPIFESMGKVVELVVVRDRATHESKGSAFVWYQTREEAERAILHFNMRHVLPDPAGEQDRPLAVRVAYRRHKLQPVGIGMSHVDPMAVMGDMPVHLQMPMGPMMQGGMAMGHSGHMHPRMGGMGMPGMGMHEGGGREMDHPYRMQQQGGYGMMQGGRGGHGMGGMYQGHGEHLMPSGGQGSHGNHGGHGNQSGMGGGAGGSGGPRNHLNPTSDTLGQVTRSLQLSSGHIQVVSNHLYSIQAMSSAQVRVAPGGPDAFFLMISGTEQQVESAEALITTVLNQTPGAAYA